MGITLGKARVMILLAALIAIIAIGVRLYQWSQITAGIKVPTDFSVERISTGGLSGEGDGTSISIIADGTMHVANKPRQKLARADVQKLVRQIKTMNFFALAPMYPLEYLCSDSFISTITVTMNSRTKMVSYEDCRPQDIPSSLVKLDHDLLELAK